ncbi:hypothetical protein J6TS7_01960 [Paenibacillus dendritiformis]|nr:MULTISPECIES: hypothetical protein [Paenibacillus]GIO76586.1 hypothetical protein J6TS7_01960 [Paenibacillus dendritiformis]
MRVSGEEITGGVSQALQNDGDDELKENVDAGKTAARKPVENG